jgi:hypothetical protein
MTLQCLVEATNYEAPHHVIVSVLLYFDMDMSNGRRILL